MMNADCALAALLVLTLTVAAAPQKYSDHRSGEPNKPLHSDGLQPRVNGDVRIK